jgi:hypothetical protein
MATPGKYSALLNDPNTRAAVPTRFLSPAQQKMRVVARQRKAENQTLYNPNALLSGDTLRRAVKSEVDAQINPQLAAYDRQTAQLRQQGTVTSQRLGGYYGQLQATMPAAQAAQQSSASALAAQLAGIGQHSQDVITQAQQEAQARGVQDQALRGTGLDAGMSQRLAAEFAAQKGAAAAQTSIAASQAGAQAMGSQGVAGTMAAVLPARALDAQTVLASNQQRQIDDVLGKRADVEAQRGGLTADTLNKLRQQQFENSAAAQTLHLKGVSEQNSATAAAARIAETAKGRRASERARQASTAVAQQNANTSAGRLAEQQRHDHAMESLRTRAAKNPNALTPSEKRSLIKANNDYRGKIRGAIQIGQGQIGQIAVVKGQVIKDANGKPHRVTINDVRQGLVKKYGDGDLVDAAVDIIQNGSLSVDVAQRLRARHIGIPKDWLGYVKPPRKAVTGSRGDSPGA